MPFVALMLEQLIVDEQGSPQCAAGIARCRRDNKSSNNPDRSSFPLATQLSATPPGLSSASRSASLPYAIRSKASSVTFSMGQ